jgi:hypothetical protein
VGRVTHIEIVHPDSAAAWPRLPDPCPREPLPQAARSIEALEASVNQTAFTLHGTAVPFVASYKYLGFWVHSEGTNRINLARRVAAASNTARKLRHVWSSRHVRPAVKSLIFRNTVMPTLLYGHETWALSSSEFALLNKHYKRLARQASGNPTTRLPDGTYVCTRSSACMTLLRVPPLRSALDIGKLRLLGSLHRGQAFLPHLTLTPQQAPTHRGPRADTWSSQALAALARHGLTLALADSPRQWGKRLSRLLQTTPPHAHLNNNNPVPSSSDSD